MLRHGVLFLLLAGCVSGPRALTTAQLEAFSTRRHDGTFDQVFDATVLSLARMGLSVRDVDPRAGTLAALRRDGTGYQVSVRSRGPTQEVLAVPVPERERWVLDGDEGESARWDQLEQYTAELLAAWREHPEWQYLPEKNLVRVLSFAARLPPAWERVEPSVSRRVLVVQRHRSKKGFNPTIVLEVLRRRPVLEAKEFLLSTAEAALGAKTRLAWPEPLELTFGRSGGHGEGRVFDGPLVRPVSWHLWDQRSPSWTVRIAAICGPGDTELNCEDAWEALTASIVGAGFEFPRLR
ncbi:MAG: hypothetical protein JNJ54_23815 [Myxococcaceae bacterium]|nr:hypothetical protein [Myxococcaceae bacterium]